MLLRARLFRPHFLDGRIHFAQCYKAISAREIKPARTARGYNPFLLRENCPVNTVRAVAEKPHLTRPSRNDAEWRAIRERR